MEDFMATFACCYRYYRQSGWSLVQAAKRAWNVARHGF